MAAASKISLTNAKLNGFTGLVTYDDFTYTMLELPAASAR